MMMIWSGRSVTLGRTQCAEVDTVCWSSTTEHERHWSSWWNNSHSAVANCFLHAACDSPELTCLCRRRSSDRVRRLAARHSTSYHGSDWRVEWRTRLRGARRDIVKYSKSLTYNSIVFDDIVGYMQLGWLKDCRIIIILYNLSLVAGTIGGLSVLLAALRTYWNITSHVIEKTVFADFWTLKFAVCERLCRKPLVVVADLIIVYVIVLQW